MTQPNVGSLAVFASGKVDGAGALTDGVNILGVVRNGAGDYTITLGSDLDITQGHLSLTVNQAGTARAQENPAGATDNTRQVLAFAGVNSAVATDTAFSFILMRSILGPQ